MAQPLAQHLSKTPLAMVDKDQFISHVNEEHQDELAMFVNAFTDRLISEYDVTSVKEIYADGLLLDVATIYYTEIAGDAHRDKNLVSDHTVQKSDALISQYFIHFIARISDSTTLQEQYITLLQMSARKLGKRTVTLQEQRFTVIDGYYASPNLYRLVVTAPEHTPLNHAGYAYLFELNPTVLSASTEPSENHDKPLQRYYTLRKAWQDSDSASVQAWIDVYIHGDTPGGNWARSLSPDMQIKSMREYPENTEHLTDGQCLLICDETSLPTVAHLLENWQNPLPPLVIAITNDPEDISYLQELRLSDPLHHDAHFLQNNLLHIVNTPTANLAEQISALLNTSLTILPLKIGKVWGALEATEVKLLRKQLKTTLDLSRQDMVLKVYWRAQ
ncbi:siderophore-interacting protein [Psychrobacter vallis]|uniref:siderophore-interacting protein n=1 Tax=Psychrobacter vallis TaxID=248451 RepID=UPI001918ADD4|nr:siderophore-interacting protein [Psychrobacter vallis]